MLIKPLHSCSLRDLPGLTVGLRGLVLATLIAAVALLAHSEVTYARQQPNAARPKPTAITNMKATAGEPSATLSPDAPLPVAAVDQPDASERERRLLERVEQLERRVAELESRNNAAAAAVNASGAGTVVPAADAAPVVAANGSGAKTSSPAQIGEEDRSALDFFRGTTVNLTIDGYYGYNFNRPVGQVNLLRAYDVQSNSFSLNQAAVVIERAPDVEAGRRFGARLDLQYGQATETVQGNAANEPRPQVYRQGLAGLRDLRRAGRQGADRRLRQVRRGARLRDQLHQGQLQLLARLLL